MRPRAAGPVLVVQDDVRQSRAPEIEPDRECRLPAADYDNIEFIHVNDMLVVE